MAHFEEKNKFLFRFPPFYWFGQKQLFKQIKIFIRICPFSNLLRKTNFLSVSVLFSEILLLGLKRKVLCEFPQKFFKTTEKHSLAVSGSLWGEKKKLIFVPFYWFDQKQLFKQIQIFHRICPFSNLLRKTNFLSISVHFFWDSKMFD